MRLAISFFIIQKFPTFCEENMKLIVPRSIPRSVPSPACPVVKIKLLRLAVFFMMPQFCGSLQGFALFHIMVRIDLLQIKTPTFYAKVEQFFFRIRVNGLILCFTFSLSVMRNRISCVKSPTVSTWKNENDSIFLIMFTYSGSINWIKI